MRTVALIVAVFSFSSCSPAPVSEVPNQKEDEARELLYRAAMKNLEDRKKVSVSGGSIELHGSVFVGSFVIENGNDFAIKDVDLACDVKGRSGTVTDTVRETVYDSFKPGQSKRTGKINFGFVSSQASSVSCEIASVQRE